MSTLESCRIRRISLWSGFSGTGGREDPITQKDVADTTILGLQEHGHGKPNEFVQVSEDVADTSGKRRSSGLSGQDEGQEGFTEELNNRDYRRRGRPTKDFWSVEPDVGRVAHGIPRRVDRLKGLGNAIVPQIAMNIGLAIKEQVK